MARKIFISYAHENHAHALRCYRAVQMLCARLRGTTAIFLDCEGDDRLRAGDEWEGKILAALEEADVYLVLMSDAYFASRFCRQVELKRILERWQAEPQRIKVIGVALHGLEPASFHADGSELSLGRFQCLPQGQIEGPIGGPSGRKLGLKPISDWPEGSSENAWHAVALGIEEALHPSRWERLTSRRGRPRLALGLVAAVLAVAGLVAGVQWFRLAGDIRQALRIDRPERAMAALDDAPAWLKWLPAWQEWQSLCRLHADGLSPDADASDLVLRLKALEARRPRDADLLYLRARLAYQDAHDAADLDRMAALAQAVLEIDPAHAAAMSLLGLALDLRGDLQGAAQRYEQAARLAPEIPQYAASHARTLLDLGRPTDALRIYRGLRNLPLAQAEQALVHWALGEFADAARQQDAALRMLDDPRIAAQPANQRGWLFLITDPQPPGRREEIALDAAQSRCYVAYGLLFSRALADPAQAAHVAAPVACKVVPELRDVVDVLDADLCRYVVAVLPPASDAAEKLRLHLGMQRPCRSPRA